MFNNLPVELEEIIMDYHDPYKEQYERVIRQTAISYRIRNNIYCETCGYDCRINIEVIRCSNCSKRHCKDKMFMYQGVDRCFYCFYQDYILFNED